jgi:hypothetical protein
MYKLHKNSFNEISIVIRDDGNGCFTSIPMHKDNTDYQAYLKWVSEGGVPLPANE